MNNSVQYELRLVWGGRTWALDGPAFKTAAEAETCRDEIRAMASDWPGLMRVVPVGDGDTC